MKRRAGMAMAMVLVAVMVWSAVAAGPAEARKQHAPKPRPAATITQTGEPAPKHAKKPKPAPKPKPAAAAVQVVPAELRPAATLTRTLSPLPAQTTDAGIARDLDAIDAWQAKLANLPGASDDVWRAAAAKAWLEAARVEYTDNDLHGFPQAAFERAVALVSDIEAGKAPVDSSNAPPAVIPRGSTRVADSLYAKLDSLKHNPGFRCAREPIAQLEVELAWTGNEQIDQGDCHTSPHLARANELAAAAREAVEHCIPPPVANLEPPPVPAPAPDTVPAMPVPTKEELRITRNVHFALNEFVLGTTSHHVISGIVALLVKYPSITVRLVGNTDSRGSPEYNLALSKRRVDATRAIFVQMGIDSTRLSTDYRGKSELYAIEDSRRGFALNRRVEMVFVDAQGRDIRGEAQEGDLQLEAERAKHAPSPRVAPKPPIRRRTTATGTRPKRRPATKP